MKAASSDTPGDFEPHDELRRQLLAVVRAAYGDDPVMGLRGSQSLRELYLEREELAVKWARGQGIGWRRVASALGTTRNSLYARYRDSFRHLGAAVVETRDLGEWMAGERGNTHWSRTAHREEESTMSEGRYDELKGRAKEAAGDLADDDDLRRSGRRDKAGGKAKQAVDHARDAVVEKVDQVKEKLDDDK
ncbi:MAG TPA: CsbD family protein [Acidimicrobiia bacterium]